MYKQTKWTKMGWNLTFPKRGSSKTIPTFLLKEQENCHLTEPYSLVLFFFSSTWPDCTLELLKIWEFPGLWASFFPQSPSRCTPLQVQKEKSVAIHVIIVKTMISAKQDSAKKSLVHYTSQISVMFS